MIKASLFKASPKILLPHLARLKASSANPGAAALALLLSFALPGAGTAGIADQNHDHKPATAPLKTNAVSQAVPLDFPACPIEALRKAYTELLSEEDTFNVLAVEEQVLLVCRERQQLIKAYKEGVEEIALGLTEMVTQSEDLRNAQGNLATITQDITRANQELTKTKAELEQIKTQLWQAKESARIFASTTPNDPITGQANANIANAATNAQARDTSMCQGRYALIGTGKIKGKTYAIIADEVSGASHNAFLGETLPFGVKVISIEGLKVTIDTGLGQHLLPVVSADWETASRTSALQTDGLIWYAVDPAKTPQETKPNPVAVKVFKGLE